MSRSIVKTEKVPNVISLHGEHEVVLEAKHYHVDVLGGWGVKVHRFSVRARNLDTGEIVISQKALLRTQGYAFSRRSKTVQILPIAHSGRYAIECENTETLVVKYSNLFLRSYFQRPLPNAQLQIYIH